jgi:hypothetical protein
MPSYEIDGLVPVVDPSAYVHPSAVLIGDVFQWDDPCCWTQQLTDDERAVRDAARAYCQERWHRACWRPSATRRPTRRSSARWASWACWARPSPSSTAAPGLNYVAYGLIAREVERVDSGYRSMMSVQSSLVMVPINEFGTEATEAEVPAQAGHRRMDRLLRPDRAQPRLRPRQHDHARPQGGRRLQPQRLQDVDHQQPDRRCLRGLGQGRRRADPRLRARKGLEGPERAGHPRQGRPARQHHRRDRDGRRVLPRGERLPRGARPEGPLHLPEQRALRHRLGRAGCGRGLLRTARASTCWTASSSASRWPPTS